jgi:hypothetical protein
MIVARPVPVLMAGLLGACLGIALAEAGAGQGTASAAGQGTASAAQGKPRPAARAAPAPGKDFKTFERKPTVLSDEELDRLRRAVLARCDMAPTADPSRAPWYYHYELGLELERRKDPQRALDALLEAVARKARPERRSRMYGMWFQDYRPYFEIAKLHAMLGNWQCAADALRLSERAAEVRGGDGSYGELQELKSEVQAQKHRQP